MLAYFETVSQAAVRRYWKEKGNSFRRSVEISRRCKSNFFISKPTFNLNYRRDEVTGD